MISESLKNEGFTLIELAIVITILGILAAMVAPKSLELSNDAKAANLQAIGGAMKNGIELINAKARIDGQEYNSGKIQINGINIPLYNGFPAVNGKDHFVEINRQIKAWLDIDTVDRNTARKNRSAARFFTDKSSANNQIFIFFTEDYDQKSSSFKCYIRYENQVSSHSYTPIINIETRDC